MSKRTLSESFKIEEQRLEYLGGIWAIWRKIFIPLALILIGTVTYLLGASAIVIGIIVGLSIGPLVAGDKILILIKMKRQQA